MALQKGSPARASLCSRGCWASARARTVSPRSDVAAAAGRITLLALCWYPFERGLRREALEVPAVVNVGSAHSRRGLSHGGWGLKERTLASPEAQRGGGVSPESDKCCIAFLWLPLLCHPLHPPYPRSLLAAFLRKHKRPQTSSSAAVISGTAIPAAAGSLGGPGTVRLRKALGFDILTQ